MADYYLYRISPEFDGFTPDRIPERSPDRRFIFNWATYLESVECGDIVLIYFTGKGCRSGIYALGVVEEVDLSAEKQNVSACLLQWAADNRKPLIPVHGNKTFFDKIRTRPRGAEVVIPEEHEAEVFRKLSALPGLLAEARRRKVSLPGEIPSAIRSILDVPPVDCENDLASRAKKRGIIAAFWIRPSRTYWLRKPPIWMSFITGVFKKYKSGDISYVKEFADILASQIKMRFPHPTESFDAIISVPLNQKKIEAQEVDRVHKLGEILSKRIGVPYYQAFRLDGNVSRRLYKSVGLTTGRFVRDYLANLSMLEAHRVSLESLGDDCLSIILLDDVFTDGVTTRTIERALRRKFPHQKIRIQIATVGIMTKKANVAPRLQRGWS